MDRRTLLGFGALTSAMAVGVAWLRPKPVPRWPAFGSLRGLPLGVTPVRRVFLDAGHGALGNPGNTSAYCVPEEAFTRSLADDVARWLESNTAFAVRRSRRGDDPVAYARRVAEAESWKADAFVSLHSDVRGEGTGWSPSPGRACLRSRAAPGFSVLYTDEDPGPRTEQSRALARGIARGMRAAGFIAYGGEHYGTSYARDDEVPGVFVDRHEPGERIFVLRKPSMPAVLVETHHALDDREAQRWRQRATREVFATALARALSA